MLAKLGKQYCICHRKLPQSCPPQTAGGDQPLETMVSASALRTAVGQMSSVQIPSRCFKRSATAGWSRGGVPGELRRSQPAPTLLHYLALVALAASVGCTSFGPELPNSTPDEISLRGPSPAVRTLTADGQIEVLSSRELAKRLHRQLPEQPLSIIAFSGGGAGGAFGAGVLAGLTQNGTRPPPSVVTGVSAGALIAPFAFLGPAWDQELIAIYRDGATEGLLRKRLFAGLFGSSVYSDAPLRRLIARYADDAMIQAIAIESSKGRLLLVATTDFASGEPVIWDLTSIAAHAGQEDKALFRSILLASASVPGMFPPVTIKFRANGQLHVETHVDGGVTMPFFIAPAPQDLPGAALGGLPPATVQVVIDDRLRDPPHVTRANALSIFGRSVSAGLSRMRRTALESIKLATSERGFSFAYAAVPVSYPLHGGFDFDPQAQRSLFEYASTCAAAGRLWMGRNDNSDFPMRQRELRPPTECPADDSFLRRFAALEH